MKITYYAATSLDGFIAREDGDVSWLDDLDIDMDATGYEDFYASVDGLFMGRETYDFIFGYGSWPYGDKPVWVFTSRDLKTMKDANLTITRTTNDAIQEADLQGLRHIWLVGGGKIASSFIEKGLLTHLSISEMPIKLETGIPLFSHHKLENISSKKTEVFQKKSFKQIEITL